RRSVDGSPDQAARPGHARRPAAPEYLAAVARRVARPWGAVQDGGRDVLDGAGGVGPRRPECAGLGRTGSHRAGRLGGRDRGAVVAGTLPATTLLTRWP